MDRASSTRVALSREHRSYLAQFAIVFVAYVVAGKLGQATTSIRSSNLGPVWPAYGVALAAVLLCGYRIWPALALGSFIVAYTSPESYLTALGQATATTLAAMTGGFLCRRVAHFDNSLSRLRDALAFILLGALASAALSASIGTLVLHATKIHAYSGLASEWLIYWLGDSSGALLITPFALTFPELWTNRDWRRLAEFACLLLLLVGACTIVFDNLPIIPVRMVAFAVLPLIIWASIRFGVSGAALSILLVATVATVQTALGSGSFASATPFINGIQLDGFFIVLSLTGLTFASLYSETQAAERERERSLRERVAMEVRLQDSELLRDNEERLRLAVKAGRMFAYSWDAESDAMERSGESAEILGVDKDQPLTRAAMYAMAHPDDKGRVERALAGLSAQNPTLQISYQIIRPDGAVVCLEQHSHAYFDSNGKLSRLVGMIVDITERKRGEEALRISEERLRLAQQASRIGAFEWNIRTGANSWTPELESLYGLPPGSFGGTQTAWENLLHPEDRDRARALVNESLKTANPMQAEWRVIWPDGSVHWIAGRWRVLMNDSGEPSRMVGINLDVTDRKQADEALSEVNRKLIEAQESERSRIGRELHDDITQRLALLTMELGQLQEHPSEVARRLRELHRDIEEISNDVQSLSHDLHSSKLEYLGVVAGIKSWCRDFSERQTIEIRFTSDVSSVLPFDIGRTLLRILQEAVHNTIKHSAVKSVDVQLLEEDGELYLVVSDSGRGFNVDEAMKGKGLGLTSMRERAKLINGTISIESRPMGGTTVRVRVPLGSEHSPLSEAV
jgi:PAS domain S-box-containing protein